MNYIEIISWAEDKIKHEERQKAFDIELDAVFPIKIFNTSNDAVRELVLETCDTTARTPISEINLLNNEDMLALEKKYNDLKSGLKSDIKTALLYLQKAYDSTMFFADYVNKEIAEIKQGGKSITDMEKDLKYIFPQSYDFIECDKTLNMILKK